MSDPLTRHMPLRMRLEIRWHRIRRHPVVLGVTTITTTRPIAGGGFAFTAQPAFGCPRCNVKWEGNP